MSAYAGEILALTALGGRVVDTGDIGVHALEYAARGWAVFPLRGKAPFSGCRRCVDRSDPDHPKPLHPTGECAHGPEQVCHAVLSATSDLPTVAGWWGGRYRGANIAARVPDGLLVLDVDPRSGGHEHLAQLEARHGRLPGTLTCWSGRGDGGRHLYWRRPPGEITARRLRKTGIDLKTPRGYCVMPPSVHPDSGRPYRWEHRNPAAPPRWLAQLLRPETPPVTRPATTPRLTGGPSIADDYTNSTRWPDILQPHGWRCVGGDGDSDGSKWRHPDAHAAWSATIRHGLLFCYSTSTDFTETTAGDPHGYTRFAAYAVLEHQGDQRAAARELRNRRSAA